jgi:hypothetical protein
MKKLPKAIETRINEINDMLHQVDAQEEYAYTYAGGTWPYHVDIKPIQVNGLKVTIEAKDPKWSHNYIDRQTYKASDLDTFSEKGLVMLKEDLSIILKALKKALK